MPIDASWIEQRFPEIISPIPLGSGGQKSVFAGQHRTDGEVVLKLFYLDTEEERVAREVRAGQVVPSARIPQVFESGTTDTEVGSIIWVREQRIHGKSLGDILSVNPYMDPKSILILSLHMLEALTAAESVRIVHRDVKPDNIIAANDGSYWLIDFGFARHLDMKSITATALAFGFGTAGYAPPEQVRNLKPEIDSRADLFALGVTLFQCIEGRNPFHENARDMGEIIRRVENIPLPPISRKIDSNNQFRDLVLAMTRRQPEHRPATAAEALLWIQEICTAEGIL